jgi:hypothetical protein
MKVSQIRWLFLGLLAFLIVLSIVLSGAQPVTFGASAEWSDGRYQFAGGTNPPALLLAAVAISLYILLMYAVPSELGKPLPGLFRRYVAFWLDFILAMVGITPILGLLPMIVEWRRTGVFRWTFARGSSAPSDGLLATLSVSVTFVALLFYYAWPLIRRRPSPGACVLKYQVLPDDGETLPLRSVVLRVLLGFVAVASFPIAPFISRDRKNGKFWLDKVFNTRALLLR